MAHEPDKKTPKEARPDSLDFIRELVSEDVAEGKHGGRVHTRFPPEPNGYLHIGHSKSICLNFGVAEEFSGQTNLRFDDTNPVKEEEEFVEGIKGDIHWLGYDWGDRLYHASDYFGQLYAWAVQLVTDGKAYVDSETEAQIREHRGTVTTPGMPSPYRDRSVEENLDLLARMKAGEFDEGAHVLRAKIDMASPNMKMRDPLMYRIKKATHHQTGDDWVIYPMYDFAHGLSDSIEGITHSLCTLEFEVNRPLYDWFLEELNVENRPQQIEFARLSITYTVLSKRKLRTLIEEGLVDGWDDPRMPTIRAFRRRGFTPGSIRRFCDRIGVAKRDSLVDITLLENELRDELNKTAPRVMAVLDPLKVVITNYPKGEEEELEAVNNPEDADAGSRRVPFSREVYIERGDFMEDPPRKFFRLAPGREVRLKHAYLITCEDVVKDTDGNVVELHCRYDPDSRGGEAPDGRKVRGTLHWVSVKHGVPAEVRLYDRLFTVEDPNQIEDFHQVLNPDALVTKPDAIVEPSLRDAEVGSRYQFLRHGYFAVDRDSEKEHLVFNRAVGLRDTWAKVQNKK